MVLAPPEELGADGHVKVEEIDGLARVTIADEVTNIMSKGAIKGAAAATDDDDDA